MKKNITQFKNLLDKCKVEADVRAAYAKYFDIPFDASEYIDLYTPQVLFEFKYDKNLSKSSERARVLAQSLYYIHRLKFGELDNNASEELSLFSNTELDKLLAHIKPVSPYICLADVNEAILTKTQDWEEFYSSKKYDWAISPSSPDEKLVADLQNCDLQKNLHTYDFRDTNDLTLFEETLRHRFDLQLCFEEFVAKKQINEQNFEQVFQYWNKLFGQDVKDNHKPSRYFVSDIQDGNTLVRESEGRVLFRIENSYIIKKISLKNYNWFWSIFDKVTSPDIIRGILAKIDRLSDDFNRRFEGEFYTPIPFATKALEYIAETIGANWWESGEYRLWDMAAGTGNLEYNLPAAAWSSCYLSTLREDDVEHLHKLFPDATVFQYNYLDDDIDYIANKVATSNGDLDFAPVTSSLKMPQKLVADLNNPKIKWIILINPPFATSQTAGTKGESKSGVSDTNVRKLMHQNNLGEVSRELFSQFIYRIKYEFEGKTAYLSLFSKIKYLNATNDQKLRDSLFQFLYKCGFVFSSVNFSGTSRSSQFPVGFLIWSLNSIELLEKQQIIVNILDQDVSIVGTKTILTENKSRFLSKWILRPICVNKFPPFGSAIASKFDNKDRRDRIAEGFLASLMCAGNDFSSQNYTAILSAPSASAGALSITPDNFEQSMIVHAARCIPKATWLNDRDQFLAPQGELIDEFVSDCTIWNIFSDSNQTAALKDVEYEGIVYQIHNNFFPYLLSDVKSWRVTDADIRATLMSAEDRFLAKWIAKKHLSAEAQELFDKGKEIYQFYFEHLNELPSTNKFKIETWDAGWYQIRMSLNADELAHDLLVELKVLHNVLRNKLLTKIKEYKIIG